MHFTLQATTFSLRSLRRQYPQIFADLLIFEIVSSLSFTQAFNLDAVIIKQNCQFL